MDDLITRQEAIRDIRSMDVCVMYDDMCSTEEAVEKAIIATKRNAIFCLERIPSAEPKIIHCKNCKLRDSDDCPMYYKEWIEIDEGDGYFDTDNIIHDWTTDEGFCHCAESRGGEE